MPKIVKVLSIDGGGIRGIIPGMILSEIERKVGKPTASIFDLLAGTSTGALWALSMARPNTHGKPMYKAQNIVDSYESQSKSVFSRSFWHKFIPLSGLFTHKYSSQNRQQVALQYFGNTLISEALTPILVPSYELEQATPFFFKTTDAQKNKYLDFLFSEVAQATCAAPTYFEPFIIDSPKDPMVKHYAFIDGGVVANNPAMCAYVEAKSMFPDADHYLVVSLGTGDFSTGILIEETKRWGLAQWIKPVFDIFLYGPMDVVDHQMKALFQNPTDKLNYYYRFQLRLHKKESSTDNPTELNIHTLKILGEKLLRENKLEIDNLCKLLKENTK